MQDAQQRMAELERMLDKLRNARADMGGTASAPKPSAGADASRWASCRT